MLDHLVRCEGIEEYKVLFFVEPDTQFLHAKKGVTRDNRVITDIINSYDLNSEIIVNKRLLGIYKNKIKALLVGFHQSDYVIHIEDDILLAKDALRFFEHCKKYGEDKSVFSVTAYNRTSSAPPSDQHHDIGRRQYHHCWPWATWRDRWEELCRKKWSGNSAFLNEQLLEGRVEIFPVLSRSQNLGYQLGEFNGELLDEEYMLYDSQFVKREESKYKDHAVSFWAEQHSISDTEFIDISESK